MRIKNVALRYKKEGWESSQLEMILSLYFNIWQVSVWKPSNTAVLSNWTIFKIFREAGLPDGVCNFVPCRGPDFGDTITSSPHLAAVAFTGGTE